MLAKFKADFSAFEGRAKVTPAAYAGVPHAWIEVPCSSPPRLVGRPQPVTVVENQKAVFDFGVAACGTLEYQWSKDGAAIQGAVSDRLIVDPATMDNNGAKFSCAGGNAFGTVSSDEAALTVLADTTGPEVLSAAATSASKVVVHFSEPVELASAQIASNYEIRPSVQVTGATLSSNRRSVEISVSPLTAEKVCTLTVSNVKDVSARHTTIQERSAEATFRLRQSIDSIAPGQAPSLRVERYTETYFELKWSNPADEGTGLAGFWIIRDGVKIGWVRPPSPEQSWFSDKGVARTRLQVYEIISVDSAGNCSTPLRMLFDGTNTIPALRGDSEQKPASDFIEILQPKAGARYKIGDTLSVTWRLFDLNVMGQGILFSITLNAGRTWHLISEENAEVLSSDSGVFKWAIPDQIDGNPTVSDECMIRVEDYSRGLDPVVTQSLFGIVGTSASVEGHGTPGPGGRAVMSVAGGMLTIKAGESVTYAVDIYSVDGRRVLHTVRKGAGVFRLPQHASVARLRVNGSGPVSALVCSPQPAR